MHRWAHGGAWGAAALLIGTCSFCKGTEPPSFAPTGISSSGRNYSSGAAVPFASPSVSSSAGMTPIGSTTRAIEIVPTPIVPYASVLSQQGQLFSPTTVANIPYAPHVLPATTIDLTPTDSGTTKVLKILDAGRLVPVNLPGLENGTKEKPLKAVPAALEKPVVVEKKMASAQAEAKPTPAVATPLELGSVAKKIAEGETSETKTALESAPKKPAVVEGQAKIVPLPPVEREEPSREAVPQKAMPLKTAPQKATPLNLPQPPIPLEYPKTGL